MRKVWCIAIFTYLLSVSALAQENDEADRLQIIEQRIEQIAEAAETDNIDYTTLFEQLTVYLDFPLNLNVATTEELYGLGFLSNYQIGQFLEYREKYGQVYSIYELPQIDGWDVTTAQLIEPFVVTESDPNQQKITFKKLRQYGKNELVLRWTRVAEEQFGYTDATDEELAENENARYLGSQDRFYARYRYRYSDRVSFGLTAEKDPGEEFFRGSQTQGFDFYSAHVFLKDFGRLKKLAIGDYQAQFGQGLTFWSGLGFNRKSSFTISTAQAAPGIGPYTSVNENLFLRGGAATFQVLKHLNATVFYSGKRIDGNLVEADPDSLDLDRPEVVVTSFQESGFHRTPAELADKNAIFQQHMGGHIRYAKRKFQIGITAAHMELDGEINRATDTYSQFRFSGSENFTMGFDYAWKFKNFFVFGETARSENGGTATLNGLNINMNPRLSVNITQRYYSRDFQRIAGVGFGEGSSLENESGLYFGVEFRPFKKWKFNAFYDQFSFPWLRYQTDAPSEGHDFLGQLDYQPSSRFGFYVRYRDRLRKINGREETLGANYLVDEARRNLRINFSYRTSSQFRFRSRVEFSDYKRGAEPTSKGFLLYQDVIYDFSKVPLRLTFRYALFDSDTYDSRLYAFENDLLYSFSIPAYSGRGTRIYALLKYSVGRNLDVWFKWGQFYYTDRDVIGSGKEAIVGPTKTELRAQIRYKF